MKKEIISILAITFGFISTIGLLIILIKIKQNITLHSDLSIYLLLLTLILGVIFTIISLFLKLNKMLKVSGIIINCIAILLIIIIFKPILFYSVVEFKQKYSVYKPSMEDISCSTDEDCTLFHGIVTEKGHLKCGLGCGFTTMNKKGQENFLEWYDKNCHMGGSFECPFEKYTSICKENKCTLIKCESYDPITGDLICD